MRGADCSECAAGDVASRTIGESDGRRSDHGGWEASGSRECSPLRKCGPLTCSTPREPSTRSKQRPYGVDQATKAKIADTQARVEALRGKEADNAAAIRRGERQRASAALHVSNEQNTLRAATRLVDAAREAQQAEVQHRAASERDQGEGIATERPAGVLLAESKTLNRQSNTVLHQSHSTQAWRHTCSVPESPKMSKTMFWDVSGSVLVGVPGGGGLSLSKLLRPGFLVRTVRTFWQQELIFEQSSSSGAGKGARSPRPQDGSGALKP